jgi:hypothetical protein
LILQACRKSGQTGSGRMYGDGRAVHTRFFTIAKSLVFMLVRASQCAFHPRQLRPPNDARFVNSESGARVRGSIWLRAQGCFRRSFSQEVGQMNVAWNVETTMRFSAAVIGCAATPALASSSCTFSLEKGHWAGIAALAQRHGPSGDSRHFRTLVVSNHTLGSLVNRP